MFMEQSMNSPRMAVPLLPYQACMRPDCGQRRTRDAPQAKFRVCARCGMMRYCGPPCAAQDWPRHEPECWRPSSWAERREELAYQDAYCLVNELYESPQARAYLVAATVVGRACHGTGVLCVVLGSPHEFERLWTDARSGSPDLVARAFSAGTIMTWQTSTEPEYAREIDAATPEGPPMERPLMVRTAVQPSFAGRDGSREYCYGCSVVWDCLSGAAELSCLRSPAWPWVVVPESAQMYEQRRQQGIDETARQELFRKLVGAAARLVPRDETPEHRPLEYWLRTGPIAFACAGSCSAAITATVPPLALFTVPLDAPFLIDRAQVPGETAVSRVFRQ